MSQASPLTQPPPLQVIVPPVTKPPFISQQTISTILGILLTFAATLHVAPSINPLPKPPVPIVAPVVDPPAVIVVDPTPAPINVTPTPPAPPAPVTPFGPVTVTDSKGVALTAISGSYSTLPGKNFIVSAPTGLALTPLASSDVDADIVKVSKTKIVCSLINACKLQVVVSGSGDPTIVTIQAVTPPSPTPLPVPVIVTPVPLPATVPVVSGPVSIGIIEDQVNRPLAVSNLISNDTLWNKYRAAGHKIRLWNGVGKPSTEVAAVQDMEVLKAKGTVLPGVVIRDKTGTILYSGPLPLLPETVIPTFAPYTGVTS